MICTPTEVLGYLNVFSPTGVQRYTPLVNLLLPFAERLVRKYCGYAVEQMQFTEYHPLISTRPSMSQGYTDDDEILAYEGSPQGARPIRQGRGNSRDVLRLCNLPVRSTSPGEDQPSLVIYEDPSSWLNTDQTISFLPSTLLIEGRDYYVDWDVTDQSGNLMSQTGFVYRSGGIWSLQARTVKVTYTAGYTSDELANTQNAVDLGQAMDYKLACWMTCSKLVKEAIANGLEGPQTTGMIVQESIDGYSVSFAPPLGGGVDVALQSDMPVGAKRLLEERVRYSKYF